MAVYLGQRRKGLTAIERSAVDLSITVIFVTKIPQQVIEKLS